MRYLWLAVKILVFLVLLVFAVNNTEPVTLHFVHDLAWQAPLVLLLLIFFAAGVGAGLLATLVKQIRLRRELARLKRELHQLQEPARPANYPQDDLLA